MQIYWPAKSQEVEYNYTPHLMTFFLKVNKIRHQQNCNYT